MIKKIYTCTIIFQVTVNNASISLNKTTLSFTVRWDDSDQGEDILNSLLLTY